MGIGRNRGLVSTFVLVIASMGGVSACAAGDEDASTEDSNVVASGNAPAFLDQWSAAARDGYYRTSEGSELLPYSWFLALEKADGSGPFRADKDMARFGYLPAPASPSNPDALPVGFAKDEDKKTGAWIGLTCAACHTSQLTYQGRSLRIDGGSGLGNLTALLDELSEALHATLTNDKRFTRFAGRVGGDRAELRKALEKETSGLDARRARNKAPRSPGNGRIDPVANIFNEAICGATGTSQNCETPSAPMKMPHVWGTADLDWVQANSIAHNPLPRNISQAMGVFARTTVDEDCRSGGAAGAAGGDSSATPCEFKSTVRLQNLSKITGWVHELKAPRWPSDLLGTPDAALATKGAAIYAKRCVECHALPPYPTSEPNVFGKRFVTVKSVPLDKIGTDPLMAQRFVMRRADPGIFRDRFAASDVDAEGKVSAAAFVSLAVKSVLQNALRDELGITDPAKAPPSLFDFRLNPTATREQLLSYKARPLAGIAFAGYLLHNGSVPNVYELLLPPARRSKTFFVGSQEYDTKRLGFVSDRQLPGTTAFDTTVAGQSNAGHTYGTDLVEADRLALVEYLKTL